MMKLFHNFFDNEDTVNADYNEESQVPVATNNRKVVSFSRGKALQSNNGKIALFEPRIYGDAREITNRLLEGQAAIINFSQMDPKIALKTVKSNGLVNKSSCARRATWKLVAQLLKIWLMIVKVKTFR